MPPRILIAEDDDLQGAVLRTALEGRGYETEIVTDGLQAVRRLRTGRYDLALLDYHLPEVDGLAAARLLHDYFCEADRPTLIALTATAEGLNEKEGIGGSTSFDAVVSKRLGLSALLTVIDANLTSAAERQAAAAIVQGRVAARNAAVTRRRRLLAPLAAVPALIMVGAFVAAFGWVQSSLSTVRLAVGSAHQMESLNANAAALVGALHDAEESQRVYLATGRQEHRDQFETNEQRVDQLLVGAAPLAADGRPGLGITPEPQVLIEARMRTLAEEAQARHDAGLPNAAPALSEDLGRDAAERLRDWAANLVSTSEQAVLAGLDAIRRYIQPVLLILAAGIVYGLWNAFRAVQQRWRTPVSGRSPPVGEPWRRPALTRFSAPLINGRLLESDGD